MPMPYKLSTTVQHIFLTGPSDQRDNAAAMDRFAHRFDGELAIPYYQGEDTHLAPIGYQGRACHALVLNWLLAAARGESFADISDHLYSNDPTRIRDLGIMQTKGNDLMRDGWATATDHLGRTYTDPLTRAELRTWYTELAAEARHPGLADMRVITQSRFDQLSGSDMAGLTAGFNKIKRMNQFDLSVLEPLYRYKAIYQREIRAKPNDEHYIDLAQFIKSAMSNAGPNTAGIIHLLGGPRGGHAMGLYYASGRFDFFDPNNGIFSWQSMWKQTKLQGFKNFFRYYAKVLKYDEHGSLQLFLFEKT